MKSTLDSSMQHLTGRINIIILVHMYTHSDTFTDKVTYAYTDTWHIIDTYLEVGGSEFLLLGNRLSPPPGGRGGGTDGGPWLPGLSYNI